MAFCIKCGNELAQGAEFCNECGTRVALTTADNQSKRKEQYAGSIVKCPACGQELPSFTAICPACGHEVNSAKTPPVVAKFISDIKECDDRIANTSELVRSAGEMSKIAKTVLWAILNLVTCFIPLLLKAVSQLCGSYKPPSLTKAEKMKMATIGGYVCPNDRESILASLLYIESRIEILEEQKGNQNNRFWIGIWNKKAKSLYKLAQVMIPDDTIAQSAYLKISNIYKKVQKIYRIRAMITLVIVITCMIAVYIRGQSVNREEISEGPLVIPVTTLSEQMPQIKDGRGSIETNSSYYFSAKYYFMSDSDFEDYKEQCKSEGYTIDVENNGSVFEGFNQKGYKIRATHFGDRIDITISDRIEMDDVVWPESDLVKKLPKPNSSIGQLKSSSDTSLMIYIGDMTKADYKNYVNECLKNGFDQEVTKSEDRFQGYDKDGNYILIDYEGFNTIFIRLDAK